MFKRVLDVSPGGSDDLSGAEFGYWRVMGFGFRNEKGQLYWECLCTHCGELHDVNHHSLRSGGTKGCKKCRGVYRRHSKALPRMGC